MRAVPAGCLGRTGVRLVAEARAGEDERGRTGEKGYSVVDTNQFRNTQVGSGYQASFVESSPARRPPRRRHARRRPPVDAKKRKKPKEEDKKHKRRDKKKKLPTQDKTKKKRKAPSSSSSDDDSADAAAAVAVEPAYDDGVGGADVLPRRLAHFEALNRRLERRPAKKKRVMLRMVIYKTGQRSLRPFLRRGPRWR